MAWYNASWSYRVSVTVDKDKVPATQSNFAVYVDLSDMPAGFFTNVKSDGGDIRVTLSNGTTEVARQVVTITVGSSIGELHFNSSSLSSSVDTVYYIYYGNAAASEPAANATYGSENVWDANFEAVYHLQEAGNSDPDGYKDSTSNDNHGTGDADYPDQVDGKLSKGADWNSTANWIQITGITIASGTDKTFSFWVNPDSLTTSDFLIDIQTGRLVCALRDVGAIDTISFYDGSWNETNQAASTGSWQYISFTFASTTAKVYYNGAQVGGDISYSQKAVGGTVALGHAANLGSDINTFDGQMDEVRISDTARTLNWHITEYNNQNSPSTFYTIGAQETGAEIDEVQSVSLGNISEVSGIAEASIAEIMGKTA
jgi:hypothetical protein